MKNIKQHLNKFYQKLYATKAHLWSHCLALLGWFLICNCISFLFDSDIFLFIVGSVFISGTLFTLFIIFTILELIFFKKFKIKWNFLVKNRYYNIFWIIGIFTGVFIIIPVYIILNCLRFIT